MPEGSVARIAWERAKDRWPGVELPFEVFARAIDEASQDGEASVATDDLYLARACARADRAACDTFEREHVARIPAYLARTERDPSVLDEVKQRVRARLLVTDGDRAARISDYAGRGSLVSWVRVVALRLHASLVAERGTHRAIDEDDDDALDASAAALAVDVRVARAEHRVAVERALAAALRAVSPRDRTILRMHYADGLSQERIGRVYGVDKATVSRWLRAVRMRVADEALARIQDETGATAEEARSLMGLLLSAMSLSLPGLLESTEAPLAR